MDAYQLHAALPSWRPTTARLGLVEFLLAVTDGPDAVPPAERPATFDNDGTLACEKPRTALAEFLIAESAAQLSSATGAGGQQVLRELGALFEGHSATEYERPQLFSCWTGVVAAVEALGRGTPRPSSARVPDLRAR